MGDTADRWARGVSDSVGGAAVLVKQSMGESGPTFWLGRPMSGAREKGKGSRAVSALACEEDGPMERKDQAKARES